MRNTVRTITSAATNSSTSACTMRTMSIDRPVSCCIRGAPASIEPHRMAAGTTANGLARASRAMAIESKPTATNTPGLR